MKTSILAVALLTAISAPAIADDAFEFHGYGRAGISTSSDGGEQISAPNLAEGGAGFATGRLGAENDTYFELDFNKYMGDDWRVNLMLASGTNQTNDWQEIDFALRQFNAQAKGALLDGDEVLWAGKRYYQRKDVHWLDFFYLSNSGYGAGVEYIPMGDGKLSVAITNNDTTLAIPNTTDETTDVQSNNLDLRYAMDNGLELIGIFGSSDPSEEQEKLFDTDGSGMFLTAEFAHTGINGGSNKIIAQYSDGSLGHAAYSNGNTSNKIDENIADGDIDSAYRLIDWGVANVSDNIEVGYSLIYAFADRNDGTDSSLISLVARPTYHWNEKTSTTLELGYATEDNDGETTDLYKAVVAQEWTPDASIWSRPAIRLYAGAFGGDAADIADIENELRTGVQFEAWW